MPRTTFRSWSEIEPYGDAKADRWLLHGEGGDLKRVTVKGGYVAERHSHDFEQFFIMQEGTGRLLCAEGEIELKPGVVIHFEPDAWHEAVFDTDTVIYEVNFANRLCRIAKTSMQRHLI